MYDLDYFLNYHNNLLKQESSSIENILMPCHIFFQYASQIHKFHNTVLAWNPINIFSKNEQDSKLKKHNVAGIIYATFM